jgi:hypothetical protein
MLQGSPRVLIGGASIAGLSAAAKLASALTSRWWSGDPASTGGLMPTKLTSPVASFNDLRRSSAGLARWGAVAGITVALIGSAAPVAGAVPAAAAASLAGCRIEQALSYSNRDRSIYGSRERMCDNGDATPLDVVLKRNGITVASGRGIVIYHCVGTDPGRFVLFYVGSLTADCT